MTSIDIDMGPAGGQIRFVLHTDKAPHTSAYFESLIQKGALDDANVFRIVNSEKLESDAPYPIDVVQFGCPDMVHAEGHPVEHESTDITGLRHKKYTVSAARFEIGRLYGSFFVCLRDEPELDFGGRRQPDGAGFAAFGEVTAGFDVLARLHAKGGAEELLARPIPVRSLRVAGD